jgi:hypothetical protein
MKIYSYLLVVTLLGLYSCNQDNHKTSTESNSDTLQVKSASKASTEFNLDQVPVSNKGLGKFPYLNAPEGYKYSGDKNKKLEEKYYFYNDSLVRKVSGTYYHTDIFPSGSVFEDTFIVNEYTKEIEALGGVEIYSGGLPGAAGKLIEQEKPAYVTDMYDPMPYKYKQFLIRTNTDNIWIELCHGLNSNQIDLTVMQEKSKK